LIDRPAQAAFGLTTTTSRFYKQLAVGRQQSPDARQATGTGEKSILLFSPHTHKSDMPNYSCVVDAFENAMTVFFGLMALTFVYGLGRLVWRLRNDDIEPAGSDGKALTRKD
jgi:hypothetical protein